MAQDGSLLAPDGIKGYSIGAASPHPHPSLESYHMNTTVLLVRHGQTDSNINGFYMGRSQEDLNGTGRDQARRLSVRLASLPIAFIYTSPLRRTRLTAEIVAEPHGMEVSVREDLTEIDLGDWQGLHIDQVKQRWPELWRQSRSDPSDLTLPHGESVAGASERAVRAFRDVAAANRGKTTMIVTHQYIVRAIVSHALGVDNSIFRRFEVDNASLSAVAVGDDGLRLMTLNDTSHLQGLD